MQFREVAVVRRGSDRNLFSFFKSSRIAATGQWGITNHFFPSIFSHIHPVCQVYGGAEDGNKLCRWPCDAISIRSQKSKPAALVWKTEVVAWGRALGVSQLSKLEGSATRPLTFHWTSYSARSRCRTCKVLCIVGREKQNVSLKANLHTSYCISWTL